MTENLTKKFRRRIIFFIIFLILSVIFLTGAIIMGFVEEDAIIPSMTIILSVLSICTLIPTIIFGVSFNRIRKTKKLSND